MITPTTVFNIRFTTQTLNCSINKTAKCNFAFFAKKTYVRQNTIEVQGAAFTTLKY
jgi:hypothetical protein